MFTCKKKKSLDCFFFLLLGLVFIIVVIVDYIHSSFDLLKVILVKNKETDILKLSRKSIVLICHLRMMDLIAHACFRDQNSCEGWCSFIVRPIDISVDNIVISGYIVSFFSFQT